MRLCSRRICRMIAFKPTPRSCCRARTTRSMTRDPDGATRASARRRAASVRSRRGRRRGRRVAGADAVERVPAISCRAGTIGRVAVDERGGRRRHDPWLPHAAHALPSSTPPPPPHAVPKAANEQARRKTVTVPTRHIRTVGDEPSLRRPEDLFSRAGNVDAHVCSHVGASPRCQPVRRHRRPGRPRASSHATSPNARSRRWPAKATRPRNSRRRRGMRSARPSCSASPSARSGAAPGSATSRPPSCSRSSARADVSSAILAQLIFNGPPRAIEHLGNDDAPRSLAPDRGERRGAVLHRHQRDRGRLGRRPHARPPHPRRRRLPLNAYKNYVTGGHKAVACLVWCRFPDSVRDEGHRRGARRPRRHRV